MNPSQYNFFFPYAENESKVVAYNSYSNALALIDLDKYDMYQQFVQNGTDINDRNFISDLKRGGFLIDDDYDELNLLKVSLLSNRYDTNHLGLTIAPTADCNFQCNYCYEKHVIKSAYMSQETEEAIISFARSKIDTIKLLVIVWYGGEPLMNTDSIERLSNEFIQLCKEYNVQYRAHMITNGYLLNNENLQLLHKWQINNIQITIDGDEATHDKRRPLTDGSATYNVILNNLLVDKNELPDIALRINIDKHNPKAWNEITKFINENGLNKKITPYLGRITHDGTNESEADCFDCSEFSNEDYEFFEKHEAKHFMIKYPKKMLNFCGADTANIIAIASDGKLYKCWHDVGNKAMSYGNIKDKTQVLNKNNLQYMLYDPTEDVTCSKCKILPICMGGCPLRRVNNKDRCSIYKHNLEKFICSITDNIKQFKLKK